MRRRRAIVGLVVLALVTVEAVALRSRAPYPSLASFERVREGMTRDEVIATIGAPPGDYSTQSLTFGPGGSFYFCWHSERWVSDEAECRVLFGDDGRVSTVRMEKPWISRPQPTRLERLRQWLGL